MRILLSSDTMPDASLDVLLQACRRRSLAGLELSLGAAQGHRLDQAACPLHQQEGSPCVVDGISSIEWLRMPHPVSLIMLMIWSGAAHQMNAGLLLQAPVSDPPVATRLALLHGSDPAAARAAAGWARRHQARTAWDVTPGALASDDLDAVLEATLPTLAHVRLPGSGPEADATTGTGALLARLALHEYTGTVSLIPSPGADLAAWATWLLQKRGWGCGTAAEKQAQREAARSTLNSYADR